MKQKYLLSMLLGGALLTACSVDDDLNPAKVAQDVNPSAPVFTIGFENGGSDVTRAYFNGSKVVYQEKDDAIGRKADVMSLYHGIGTEWAGYQNAVYRFDETDADGKLTFTTGAMVQPGTAVMVYPADTMFVNKAGTAPVVKIAAEQTDATMAQSPYMTSGLEIGEYEKNEEGKYPENDIAGYDKKYDIRMKSAASFICFVLKAEATKDIDDKLIAAGLTGENAKIKIKGVELRNYTVPKEKEEEKDTAAIFTTKASIELAQEKKKYKDHDTWKYQTSLTPDDESAVATLASECKIGDEVYMAVLPFGEDVDEKSFEGLELVVKTNYGNVTIKGDDARITCSKSDREKYLEDVLKDGKTAVTVAEAFAKVVLPRTGENAEAGKGSVFEGDYIGQGIAMQVEVDLNEVDLSTMHITDNDDLVNTLKVYNVLKENKDEPATFYLDGASSSDKKFVLKKDGWTAMINQYGKNNAVNFIPCPTVHPCETIQLEGEDGGNELPDLQFGGSTAVPVELKGGVWTWTGNDDAAESKKLTNFKTLTVLPNTTLNVSGTIQRYYEKKKVESVEKEFNGGLQTDNGNVKNAIINKGTVNVTADTELRINTENLGTIEVGEKDNSVALTVKGSTVLTNREVQDLDEKDWAAEWNKNCGTINNYGILAVDITEGSETNAINNYGVINILDNNATTLVTNNADDNATTAEPFGEKNRIGTIVLCNKDSRKTTVGEGKTNQGFIKWTVKGGDATDTGIANYAVIEGGANGYTKDEIAELNENVKYLEIEKDVEISFKQTLDAIVICAGDVSVPSGATITLNDALYLKGNLLFSGNLESGETTATNEDNRKKNVWNERKSMYFGKSTGNIWSSGGKIE